MDVVDKALADLALSLALPSLALNERGVAALRLGDSGEVQFERWHGDGLLIALYRPLDAGMAARLLELCAPSGEHPLSLAAGMDNRGRLGLVTRLPRREVALSRIEHALAHMTGLFDRLER